MTVIPDSPTFREGREPPLRLAHVLFVLWIAGSVAWALYAAAYAQGHGWWVQQPLMGAGLVLAPVALAHLLALVIIRKTGNPRCAYPTLGLGSRAPRR